MKHAISSFQSSSKELKSINCLATCSMLMAVSIVLGYFSIYLTESIRISFTIIPIVLIGYLYGPVVCGCAAAGVDIINYMMKPVAGFAPGITLCAVLAAMIYGFFLYQKNFNIVRLTIVSFFVRFFIDLLLKTYVLAGLYGRPFNVYLWTRLPVQVVMFLVNTVLIYILINALNKSGIFSILKR